MSDNTPKPLAESTVSGSTEKNVRDPDWTIGGVMSEAWELKNGFKGTYWGALLIYAVIAMVASGVFQWLGGDTGLMGAIAQLVSTLVTLPLYVGLTMMAIKRSIGAPTTASSVFDYYPRTLPLFLLYVLMVVMITIGFVLLVLPGIYLVFAYVLALPLLVDKNLGLWEALETSRKAVTPCWFRVFGLLIVVSIVVLVSALPFGIGLIWTVPFAGLVMGIIYRNLVGVDQAA
jgi:hypothetical protein